MTIIMNDRNSAFRSLNSNSNNNNNRSTIFDIDIDRPREDEKNIILGISLDKYKPIEELSHYGQYLVSHTGAYNLTPPLPKHIGDYIQELNHESCDLSLWDGTTGTYGRDYLSHRPLCQKKNSYEGGGHEEGEKKMSRIEELEKLKNQYIKLIADITPRAILEKLRKSLEKQSGIQLKLEESIEELEGKIEKLQKQKDKIEIEYGQDNEKLNLIDDKIIYDKDELNTLHKVNKQLKQKVLQIELELNERETGHLRKIALLRKIFGEEPLIGGLIFQFNKNNKNITNKNIDLLADHIYHFDMLSMTCSRLLFQMKCFYLDCVQAKHHLYKIESNLRCILENLQQIMNNLTATLNQSHYPLSQITNRVSTITSNMNHHKHLKFNHHKVLKHYHSLKYNSMKHIGGHNIVPTDSMDDEEGGVSSSAERDIHVANQRNKIGERDFRLRYVRKIWNTIEGDFKMLHQYIEKTSLPIANKIYNQQHHGQSKNVKCEDENTIGGGQTNNSSNGNEWTPLLLSKQLSQPVQPVQAQPQAQPQLTTLSSLTSLTRKLSLSSSSNAREYGIFCSHSASFMNTNGDTINNTIHNNDGNGCDNNDMNNNPIMILPRFSTIELTHALNKKAKIATLHKYAAIVYKQINVIYDVHDELLQKSLNVLQKRMTDDRKANEKLISKWEELLGVSSE